MKNIFQSINLIEAVLSWVLSHGIKIILIIIGAKVLVRFARAFITKVVRRAVELTARDHETETKREDTLITVFSGLLSVVAFLTAILMILGEIGVEITPLLAGAGVVGLAISMASRNLVEDYISGVFIILEDQYRVGDVVKIGAVEGRVKDITLRRTIIVDSEGAEHFIPNGQVTITSKKPKK